MIKGRRTRQRKGKLYDWKKQMSDESEGSNDNPILNVV